MNPREEILSEAMGESLRFVEAVADELAKNFRENRSIDGAEGYELPAVGEKSVGDQRVKVWMKVRSERSEGLNRGHEAGHGSVASENFLKAQLQRVVSAASEEAEKLPLPFEQSPERFGDGEHHVSMRDGCEDFLAEFLREKRRTLGLT
jgi:hypothetical protein